MSKKEKKQILSGSFFSSASNPKEIIKKLKVRSIKIHCILPPLNKEKKITSLPFFLKSQFFFAGNT